MEIRSQSQQWINYTSGSMARRIAREGNFLWVTGGGLNRYNIVTNENMNYNHSNSGLPANDAMTVAVDKLGNKWIGMYSGDLVKFDGINWTTFETPKPDFEIMDIVVDSNNIVWIGSWYGGLLKFDGANWSIYNESNSGLPNNYVWCLGLDNENNIWIGMTGNLAKFDRTNWTIYNSGNSGLPGVAVSSILIDTLGIKWIGTQQGGLVKFDDVTWTRYGLTEGYQIDAIAIDKDYNKWVGCINCDKLYKLNDASIVSYDRPGGIMSIQLDQNGDKWIGTLYHGLYKFNNGNWTTSSTGNSGLSQDRMWSIYIDDNGHKWIGTEQRGADKFDGIEWTKFPMFNPLWGGNYSPGVMQITGDTEGNTWFATEQGVGKFDGNAIAMYTPENSPLPDWIVESVAIDQKGVKWFGTRAGLVKFNGIIWEIFDQSNSNIPGNMVKDLAIDNEGNVWMGFRDGGGIAKFNGNEWVIFPSGPNGPASSSAWDLFFDFEGNLWVAHGSCQIVSKYDGTNWSYFSDLFQCTSIAEDQDSNLWFTGYYLGLKKFDGLEWTTYTTGNSGLSSNMPTSIAIDETGNKWIGSYGGGISVFNEKGIIDAVKIVRNEILNDGDAKCFNASQTLIVAGNDSLFTIENGGSATLISGQSLVLMAGTTVESGGFLHGYITTTGNYCGMLPPAVITKPKEVEEPDVPFTSENSLFIVYPNPTTGNFILEFTADITVDKVTVEVYGIWGEKVLTTTLSGERKHEFSLSDKPTGVYFIRVVSGDKTETLKIF